MDEKISFWEFHSTITSVLKRMEKGAAWEMYDPKEWEEKFGSLLRLARVSKSSKNLDSITKDEKLKALKVKKLSALVGESQLQAAIPKLNPLTQQMYVWNPEALQSSLSVKPGDFIKYEPKNFIYPFVGCSVEGKSWEEDSSPFDGPSQVNNQDPSGSN